MGPIVSVVPLRRKWKFGHVPRARSDTKNAVRTAVSVMEEDNSSKQEDQMVKQEDNESLAKVM